MPGNGKVFKRRSGDDGGGDNEGGDTGACVVGYFALPSEVFSSPVMYLGRKEDGCVCLFVGCRDDHLYQLDVFGGFGER